jgi:hypothetical protein
MSAVQVVRNHNPVRASSTAAIPAAMGVPGNERITAVAGGALFFLLAVEGLTILQVHQLFSVHVFVGVMLVGPLAVKLGSTGYRFIRYYTGARAYREKGPPLPLLRVLAPVLVLSTVIVVGSGIGLLITGPRNSDLLLSVHRVSFFVWFGVTTVHVLAYVWRVPGLAVSDWRPRELHPHRGLRLTLNVSSLVAGAVAAALVLPAAAPWITRFANR